MHLHIGHLYPTTMSTYGDIGNIICLKKRAEWRGIAVTVHDLEIGTPLPESINCYFMGGGQDAAQGALAEDLLAKGKHLRSEVEKGVPLLAICGGYQLLGESYAPFEQAPIPGVGLFPVKTVAKSKRMIGNLVIEANSSLGLVPASTIVGFENHSGQTNIEKSIAQPLGAVRRGFGNNGEDKTEGCIYKNAIGCYLHGSLLPKNPHLADWFLQKALGVEHALPPLDDKLAWQAHNYTLQHR